MTERDDIDIEDFRARLEAERKDLEAMVEQAADDAGPVKLDQTSVGRLSRMDAMQGQAMAAETRRRRQQRISAIDAALKRIADGEYGICAVTGDDIPKERLDLDPAAAIIVKKS